VVNDVQHALCRERGLRHEAFLHPSGQGRGKVTKAPCYISADFTINNNEAGWAWGLPFAGWPSEKWPIPRFFGYGIYQWDMFWILISNMMT